MKYKPNHTHTFLISLSILLSIQSKAQSLDSLPSSDEPINYLLVIGIDHYTNYTNLEGAVKGATLFRDVLWSKYAFYQSQTITLFNEEANYQRILTVLDSLSELQKPQDNLVIFYSGRGWYDVDMDEGFMLPSDMTLFENGQPEIKISYGDIRSFIRKMSFQHILLILDTSFAGAIFSNDSRAYDYTQASPTSKSRWAITSTQLGNAQDFDESKGTSPFSYNLSDILLNLNEINIRVDDLFGHMLSRRASFPKYQQEPMCSAIADADNEAGLFIFKKK